MQGEQTVQGHKGGRGDTGVEVWRDWMVQYLVGHGGELYFLLIGAGSRWRVMSWEARGVQFPSGSRKETRGTTGCGQRKTVGAFDQCRSGRSWDGSCPKLACVKDSRGG